METCDETYRPCLLLWLLDQLGLSQRDSPSPLCTELHRLCQLPSLWEPHVSVSPPSWRDRLASILRLLWTTLPENVIMHVVVVKHYFDLTEQYKFRRISTFYRPPTKLWESNVFSSVCLSTRGLSMWPLPMMYWTSLYRPPSRLHLTDMGHVDLFWPWPYPHPHSLIVTSEPSLQTFSNLCSLDLTVQPPLVLTSGGHWSTYSWQASSMHITGMLSCIIYIVC